MGRETVMPYGVPGTERKPSWLKIRVKNGSALAETEKLLRDLSLHTVCEEATCPNRMECFSSKTATFMILGEVCTRNCTFCDVASGTVFTPDPEEPEHVAEAVRKLGLKHAVITSVTRDDLPDGGASRFADVIEAVRKTSPGTTIEVLIPDFLGNAGALRKVIDAAPEIINHNVETVPSLYPEVRPQADYRRSLQLLKRVKEAKPSMITKSGIMLGLGEKEAEVLDVMKDLRAAGCDFITIGQYLAPSRDHHPVVEYVYPETFRRLEEAAYRLGFEAAASAPFVRSSYHAGEMLEAR
jgi:lipoyl synthase